MASKQLGITLNGVEYIVTVREIEPGDQSVSLNSESEDKPVVESPNEESEVEEIAEEELESEEESNVEEIPEEEPEVTEEDNIEEPSDDETEINE